MKKLLLLCLLTYVLSPLNAQTELKVSPVGLLFNTYAFSVETAVAPSFGIDGDIIGILDEGVRFNVSGKYYFNPITSIDGFHIGAFAGNAGDAFGLGFLAGYKVLSRKRILFEIGLGVGRSFDDGVVAYGKLHLGYRFGKDKGAAETKE